MKIKHSLMLVATLSLTTFSSLAEITKAEICKATIAADFGRDPAIIKSKTNGNIVVLQYNRPDDESLWKFQCKVSGNKVLWRSAGNDSEPNRVGRWRDNPMDPVITYSVNHDVITIHRSGYDDKSFERSKLE